MKPVLRVIVPTAKLALAFSTDAKLQGSLPVDAYTDYVTEDLTPPVDAVYAAQMNADGSITEVIPAAKTYAPALPHTFAGWPIP